MFAGNIKLEGIKKERLNTQEDKYSYSLKATLCGTVSSYIYLYKAKSIVSSFFKDALLP